MILETRPKERPKKRAPNRAFQAIVAQADTLSSSICSLPVCTDPALQSLPKSFRRYLVPGEGRVFIKADFSAFQLRLLAHLSQDKALKEMFGSDRDPHDETRKRLESKGIPITRGQAKAVNFAICYSGTVWSIQGALRCDLPTAHRIVRELSSTYPGIAPYLDDVADALNQAPEAERHVTSLWGRRRCLYHEGPMNEREKRQAKNAVRFSVPLKVGLS